MSTAMYPLQRHGINKLPLEMLMKIWLLASTEYDVKGRTVPPSYLLLPLSHVCRMWRTAIRGTPRLWSIICGIEPPSLIRQIIVLSQQVRLVVLDEYYDELEDEDEDSDTNNSEDEEGNGNGSQEEGGEGEDNNEEDSEREGHDNDNDNGEEVGEGEDGNDGVEGEEGQDDDDSDNEEEEGGKGHIKFNAFPRDVAEMLFSELHRMEWLHISLNDEDFSALLPLLETAEAPFLESFCLDVRGLDEGRLINPFGGAPPPRLTRLCLYGGCEITWNSPIWTNLIHLTLERPPRDQYEGEYQLFSHALAQMSSLEQLSLYDCIPPDITVVEAHVINLPRLIDLDIRGSVTICDAFLRSIQCQLTHLSVIVVEDDDYEDYDYRHLCLLLLESCQEKLALTLKTKPLTNFCVDTTTPGDFHVRGYRPCDHRFSRDDDLERPLRLHILYGIGPDDVSPVDEELIAHVLSIVPPRELREMNWSLEHDGIFDVALIKEHVVKYQYDHNINGYLVSGPDTEGDDSSAGDKDVSAQHSDPNTEDDE